VPIFLFFVLKSINQSIQECQQQLIIVKKWHRSSNKNPRPCIIFFDKINCEQNLCLDFFRSLNLPNDYFDFQHYSDEQPQNA